MTFHEKWFCVNHELLPKSQKKYAEMSTLGVNDWKKKSSVPWCFLEERA